MKVRSASDAAKKFATRAAAAMPDYQAGVSNAGAAWHEATVNSESAYVAGVQESISDGRFGKGVRKAGAAKYQDRATKLGPQRYQQGVSVASDDYAKGVQPFLAAMSSATLSPKGARGSAQNKQRVADQIDLMRKTRRDNLT